MQFPIEQVPIPGRPQPLQQPQHYDPAGIIMQAAALRQQKELAQQQMQQKSTEDVLSVFQATASLAEKRREADAANARARATLDMQREKIGAENVLWQAHAKNLESQGKFYEARANALGGSGDGHAASMKEVHDGKMSPSQFFGGFSVRDGQRAAMQEIYAQLYPGDDLRALEAAKIKMDAAARTSGGTTVQIPEAMATTLSGLTARLYEKATAIGLTNNRALNRGILIKNTALKEDAATTDYLATNMEARRQLAQVFSAQGVPQVNANRAADEMLPAHMGIDAIGMLQKNTLPTMIGARLNALRSIGPQTAGVAQQTTPQLSGKQPKVSAPAAGGRIKVKDPNGMPGTVSLENLQEALSAGYTQQ